MLSKSIEESILRIKASLEIPQNWLQKIGLQRNKRLEKANVALTICLETLLEAHRELEKTDSRLEEKISLLQRDIIRLKKQPAETPATDAAPQTPPATPAAQPAAPAIHQTHGVPDTVVDDFYYAFENRYRGSETLIAERLTPYLQILADEGIDPATAHAIDYGCGRGEWLQLLTDAGYAQATGIDQSATMVDICQAKGLDAQRGDAIAHLESLAPESQQLITGFHIVEHLPFRLLLHFLQLAHRALAPGGIALFETPNPRNFAVGTCTFNFDPTHEKPLPIELLSFMAEFCGLKLSRVVQKNPHSDLQTFAQTLPENLPLLSLAFTSGLDYALVLKK